jgi:hypothetical protein
MEDQIARRDHIRRRARPEALFRDPQPRVGGGVATAGEVYLDGTPPDAQRGDRVQHPSRQAGARVRRTAPDLGIDRKHQGARVAMGIDGGARIERIAPSVIVVIVRIHDLGDRGAGVRSQPVAQPGGAVRQPKGPELGIEDQHLARILDNQRVASLSQHAVDAIS